VGMRLFGFCSSATFPTNCTASRKVEFPKFLRQASIQQEKNGSNIGTLFLI